MGKTSGILFKIVYKFSSNALRRKLLLLRHGWSLMVSPDSWLVQSGYVNSFLQNKTLDGEGNALPWMNYGIIGLLKGSLNTSMHVFEFGSGNSTLFFAKHSKRITSVEYDRNWYRLIDGEIKKRQLENVQYIYRGLDADFHDVILEQEGSFDLVVVDGRDRVKCALNAIAKLSDNGVLLLDDSDRPAYAEIFNFYRKNGFKFLTFSGLKPRGFGSEQSTVFYRSSQNCLNL